MMIAVLLLILITLLYNYYVHHRRNGRLINQIPGIPGYPIFGNLTLYLCSQEKLWRLFVNVADQYYPIYKIWRFFTPSVLIRHLDDLKTILNNTKHINKSKDYYSIFYPLVGTGIFTSGGAKWHMQRKILTPTLHFNILHQFVEILIEKSESMTKSLQDIEGAVVKDSLSLDEHTLNAIYETVLGISLQEFGMFQQWCQKAICQLDELFCYRELRPWLHSNWIFLLSSKGKEQTKILKILHGFTERIIAERKLYHERTNNRYLKSFGTNTSTSVSTDDAKTIGIRRKRLALLDLLIAKSQEGLLTDLDIKEAVDTIIHTGRDTATVISYLLALLAEHKDIQDHVRNEINTAMQENGEKYTIKLLENLPYLDRCIKEALRLYPSIHVISRTSAEDVKLRSYLIPAGTVLLLNIYGVHRDPNFWPNPEIFDPDRFLPDKILKRHPYSYIPFSAGPRNCIGQRFAILEIKAMIASLIQNFYLEPVDYLKDLRIQFDIILRSTHPLRIRFVPVSKTNVSL